MDHHEGQIAGELVMDTLALASESHVDARLRSVAVVVVVETPDGALHTVVMSETLPEGD